MQHPSEKELDLVGHFVEDCYSNSKTPCYNDWSIGWWVASKGGVTLFKASPPNPDYNALAKPFSALTLTALNCELIESQGFLNYFRCV